MTWIIPILISYLSIGFVINLFYLDYYIDVSSNFVKYENKMKKYPDTYRDSYEEAAEKLQAVSVRVMTMTVTWFPYMCLYFYDLIMDEINTVNRAASALKDEDNG